MKIAGVVLAGGLSTRMGHDKAKLELTKQTTLSRAVKMLEQLKLDFVVVSGQYQNYRTIEDIHENAGPLGGIHSCVVTLQDKCDAIFLLPIDMPLLTKQECYQLLQSFKLFPQGVCFEQFTFPMILPLNEHLLQYLIETMCSTQKKHRSLYRMIKTLKIQAITADKSNIFRFQNTNTPEEWVKCKEIHDKLSPNKV